MQDQKQNETKTRRERLLGPVYPVVRVSSLAINPCLSLTLMFHSLSLLFPHSFPLPLVQVEKLNTSKSQF